MPRSRGSFDRWREEISAAFVPLDAASTVPDHTADFVGGLRTSQLGALHLSEVSGRCVDVRRTPAAIRRSDPGLLKLGVQLRGRGVVEQRERQAVLAPGDFAVYDTSEPYRLHFDNDFAMFVLMFPRELLKIPPRRLAQSVAVGIDSSAGIGSMVSRFLLGLRDGLDRQISTVTNRFEVAALDLVSAVFDENSPDSNRSPAAVVLAQAQQFIDENLHDPAMNTDTVAAALHVSTRYLQKVFETENIGVAAWIKTRRLEQCRRDLEDPRMEFVNIGSICARRGFTDPAHFSRMFKETFGITPSTARQIARRPVGAG